jgi:hypothetical protein
MGDGDHGWAAAEFLSLLRLILVRETAEGLELLSGTPADWIARGGVRLTGATTSFGTLDLEVRPRNEGRTLVEWALVRSGGQDAGTIVLAMPHGDGIRRQHLLPSSTGRLVLGPDGKPDTETP